MNGRGDFIDVCWPIMLSRLVHVGFIDWFMLGYISNTFTG